MKRTKVVYDWIGPLCPLPNNESPSLLQLAAAVPDVKTGGANSLKYLLSSFFNDAIQSNKSKFDITPAFNLQEGDFFIYPIDLHHRYPVVTYFTAGHSPGFMEVSTLLADGKILQHVRDGNGYLLLNYTFECYLEPYLFQAMHNYFNHHEIPLDKIIYQTGSPDAAKVYNKYCDDNNISVRMIVGFWDVNEYNYSKNYRLNEYSGNKDFESVDKTFICLNRRFREHRDKLFAVFYKHDLLQHSYFSMPAEHSDGLGVLWKNHCDQGFLNDLEIFPDKVDYIQNNVLPLRVDDIPYHEMVVDHNRSLKHFYEKSLINVVTETTCNNYALQVSEKSYKPILYKIPFILVNSPGALAYMKKAGYQTFSEFFDESYDTIENTNERILKIGEVCKEIQSWSQDTKREFFDKTRAIVDYNYTVLREVFPNNYKGELWDLIREKT